jgi:hypothetical protein
MSKLLVREERSREGGGLMAIGISVCVPFPRMKIVLVILIGDISNFKIGKRLCRTTYYYLLGLILASNLQN